MTPSQLESTLHYRGTQMSKVYLVLHNFHYEETEVMKAFFREEAALDFIANMEGGLLIDEGKAREYAMSTVFIEEHEVGE